MSEVDEMKSGMVMALAMQLMENDNRLSIDEALAMVFNSETYQKLLDNGTRLYYQSPRYVYSYLDEELKTGKLG